LFRTPPRGGWTWIVLGKHKNEGAAMTRCEQHARSQSL
jgi:hypothetical protein